MDMLLNIKHAFEKACSLKQTRKLLIFPPICLGFKAW